MIYVVLRVKLFTKSILNYYEGIYIEFSKTIAYLKEIPKLKEKHHLKYFIVILKFNLPCYIVPEYLCVVEKTVITNF